MNILLTSVGRRSYLVKYFKDALGSNGTIHVMNSDPVSPAFLKADKATVSPLIYSKNYIPFLIEYCRVNKIKAIVSCFDIDLPILARNKKKLRDNGVTVIVADEWFVDICNDKWKTYKFLKNNRFNVPKTYLGEASIKNAIRMEEICFPIMIKPRWGMGSIAIYEADDMAELMVLFNKTKRKIMNSYLKYESRGYIDDCVIFQEKLIGQEWGMDVINDLNGNYQNCIVKKKYYMRAGETDSAITIEAKKAVDIGRKISEISRHPANLDVDLFVNNNQYYILEMNARFGGGYPFSHLAGVNLPSAIVQWLLGKKVDKKVLTAQYGVRGQKDIEIVKIPF